MRDIGVILHEKKHLLQTLKGQTCSDELAPCTSDFNKLSLRTKLEDIESQIEMCCSSLEQLLQQLHRELSFILILYPCFILASYSYLLKFSHAYRTEQTERM